MNISEFDNLIPKEISTPECPTDKFVAGFLAQMDADLAANKPVKTQNFLGFIPPMNAIAAMAAAFIFVAGGAYLNRNIFSGIVFNDNKNKEIIATHTPNDNQTADTQFIYAETEISAEDAFASQLIGYDDASPTMGIQKVSIQ